MGFDGKYGRVTTEFGDIPDDEPVMVFRAKDQTLPYLLDHYLRLCRDARSSEHHLNLVRQARARIELWQRVNGARVPVSMGPAGIDLEDLREMP